MNRDDLGAGADHAAGSRLLAERIQQHAATIAKQAVVSAGSADVYLADGFRVVIGADFVSCECPANRERCRHVERVLTLRTPDAAPA